MKRKLSAVFVSVFLIMALMPLLFLCKNSSTAYAETINTRVFSEKSLLNKQDIISVTANGFANSSVALNNSPFDTETKTQMAGYTITPNADEYGQFSNIYSISTTNIDDTKSVFMWIYIPSSVIYDMSLIMTTTDGESVEWNISSESLYNMITQKIGLTSIYGWRLFEFPVAMGQKTLNGKLLKNCEFTSLYLNYRAPSNDAKSKYREDFSFYHVYLADTFYNYIEIADYNSYVNYKIKESFVKQTSNLFVNDSFKIMSSSEIFEYMYVGKSNVIEYPNLNITWEIYISNENGKRYEMKFGNTYTFEESGYYTIGLEVSEKRDMSTSVILNYSDSVFIDRFSFGAMKSEYKFKQGTENVLKFVFSDSFVLSGDVIVSVSDKNIATESHYIKGNTCYITLKCNKSGNVKLKITAKGNKLGETKINSYEATASVKISQKSTSDVEIIILWVIFSGFCVALLVFFIILFVKARKSSVK